MGTFKVTDRTRKTMFKYENDAVFVDGQVDENTSKSDADARLQSIYGQVYRKNDDGVQGEYIGNFNGTMRDDKMKYSLSEMQRSDADIVWTAIEEIEENVVG